MNGQELRAKRDAALDAAKAVIAKAEAENRGLTTEEIAEYDRQIAEAETLRQTAERAAQMEKIDAERRATVPEVARPALPQAEVVEQKREKGQTVGTIIRARIIHGQDKRAAQEWARKNWGESSPEARALAATDFTAGGALVPSPVQGELIELLRNKAVVRRAGPRGVPLVNGQFELPKITGGATGSWVGENTNITKAEQTFGQVKGDAKTLAVLVPVSNKLMKSTSIAVDQLIRDDLVASLANTEDAAFIRNAGTQYSPKGLYYWASSSNVAASAGTALANIRTDVRNMMNALAGANVDMSKLAWFMAPRAKNYLGFDIVNDHNDIVWPSIMDRGMWYGYPVFDTNNIPVNLGAGTSTEVYLVAMQDVVIGDGDGFEIEVFPGAAYHDGTQVVSGVSQNQTVIRVIRETDLAVRHAESVAVRHTVAWGA